MKYSIFFLLFFLSPSALALLHCPEPGDADFISDCITTEGEPGELICEPTGGYFCVPVPETPPETTGAPPETPTLSITMRLDDFTRVNVPFMGVQITSELILSSDSLLKRAQVRRRYRVDNSRWGSWHIMNVNETEQWEEMKLTDNFWVNLFFNKRLTGVQYQVRSFSKGAWSTWGNLINL